MKFELKIGKVSKEFVKGDRKEVTTVEDITVTVDVAADELVDTIKSIADAIKEECSKEKPAYVQADNKSAAESNEQSKDSKSKNEIDFRIYIQPSDKLRRRFEVRIVSPGVEYRMYTSHKNIIMDAAFGRLNDSDVKKFVEDVATYKATLSGVRKIDAVGAAYIIRMLNEHHKHVAVIEK